MPDFLTEFDDWFLWQKDVHYYKLTEKAATRNFDFRKMNWKLCDGFIYGCWSPKKWR